MYDKKENSNPFRIFFVYAREDKKEVIQLKDYLIPLEKEGKIDLWLDDNILPGEIWNEKIVSKINEADIILLGISKSFFASNYIEKTELKIALKRHEQKDVIIIPILIKPCLWDISPKISSLQLLPTNGRAITSWSNLDEAFDDVSRGIYKKVKSIVISPDGKVNFTDVVESKIDDIIRQYEENQDSDVFQKLLKLTQNYPKLPSRVYHVLGYLYDTGQGILQNTHEALRLYIKAADLGYPASQYNLGIFYENGRGVSKDYEEALRWYRLSANQDYSHAVNKIGKLYESGLGVRQDYFEAKKWYLRAAEQGDDNSQSNIGYLYMMGWGVKKDTQKAYEWFLKASEKNNSLAFACIGYLNQIGIGHAAPNHNEAIKWYLKGAELGSDMALTNLGLIYVHGEGVLPDNKKAYEYFSKAADLGNTSAMCNLAKLLLDGLGVKKNYERAFALFKKAAEDKVLEAYSHLAGMYENGYGVRRDNKMAIYYYEKALEVNWHDEKYVKEMRNRVAFLKNPILEYSFIARTIWKIFN